MSSPLPRKIFMGDGVSPIQEQAEVEEIQEQAEVDEKASHKTHMSVSDKASSGNVMEDGSSNGGDEEEVEE